MHYTSSPRYPRTVWQKSIAKRTLEKSKYDGHDPLLGILEHHITPLDIGYSPTELLQGRQLRSVLPVVNSQLLLRAIAHDEVKVMLQQCPMQQKNYFDKESKPLAHIDVGYNVRFQQDDKIWTTATVLKKVDDNS